MLVRLHTHSGVPGVMHITVLILGFFPKIGVPYLDGSDEVFRFALNLEVGVHGREQDNVNLCFSEFRRFAVHRPMSPEEDYNVEGDDSERDDWPAAPLHVFVAKWDQHGVASLRGRK